MRVGVTAMSHAAIDNLMQAVVDRFAEEGDSENLRAVRKAKGGSVDGVQYVNDNPKVAKGDFNVVAGTTWLFASQAMRDNPVDVLVVDEAGQLGLADTLAATISATQRDPARRSAAVAAGVAGEPSGRCRCERVGASARRRADGAARSWRAVGDDVADASRRVRVHLRGDVRRQAAQPRVVCRPAGGGPDRPALAARRARGLLHRVGGGSGDRRREGRGVARPAVDRSARRRPAR